jgi:GMP synthase (glutamine-hydrolysing)
MVTKNRVAVLDAGGQYIDLVKKAVERQGIPVDVLPLNTPVKNIEEKYGAVIISGSPASSSHESAPLPDQQLWATKLPLLGICYGMQSMVVAGGGTVARNAVREDGRITTEVDNSHPVFRGVKTQLSALFTHGDFVKSLPKGFKTIGKHKMTDGSMAYSAIAKGNLVGVQFHPEVFDDTPEGYQIFKNFLSQAGVSPDKSFKKNRLNEIIKGKKDYIKKFSAGRHVIAFVSGGVDSSVCVALASTVIPKDKLHAFYIDTGFMRDEDDSVISSMQDAGIPVKRIDVIKDFAEAHVEIEGVDYGPLRTQTDPEIKRKIIGRAFIEVQNRIIADLGLQDAMLLQGTNAADRIESGNSQGDSHTMTIKTHHNQVKEVKELKESGRLLEPIDDLFKDEVRELGRAIGLPELLIKRQPFPGPGLAIRIIATGNDLSKLPTPAEESKVQSFLDSNSYDVVSRLLPIKSVGVGGDERSHLHVVAIRGENIGYDALARLGTELPANFRGSINRVIYSLGRPPMEDVSITRTGLGEKESAQLRHADRIVMEELRNHGLIDKVTQFPVVLIPLSFGGKGKRSIVLRPVKTKTFMTVQAMLPVRDLPEEFFDTVTDRILSEVPGISRVFLDLTNKPPGTVEWE